MLSISQRERIVYLLCQHVDNMPGKSECEGECLYRSPDGNRCLIGFLIPDSHYKESFEGKSPMLEKVAMDATDDELRDALDAGLRELGLLQPHQKLDDIDIIFLSGLQSLHDSSYAPTLVEGPDGAEINLRVWRLMLVSQLRAFLRGWYLLDMAKREHKGE